MEEPIGQETNYHPGLKLPRPKPPDSLRKRRMNKPASPKDVTPIIVNGSTVSREDITPIIDTSITITDTPNRIDLLENPNAIHNILSEGDTRNLSSSRTDQSYIDPSLKVLESIPYETSDPFTHIRSKEPKTTSQIIEEQLSQTNFTDQDPLEVSHNMGDDQINYEMETPLHTSKSIPMEIIEYKPSNDMRIPDIGDLEVRNYRKFNPPFPSDPPKSNRNIAAYIQNVESTDTSDIGNHAPPKITSPTENLIVDMKVNQYRLQQSQKREREEREKYEREEKERRERRDREEKRDRQEREEREKRERDEREKRERDEREKRERDERERRERDEREKRERDEREKRERDEREKRDKEESLSHEDLITRAHDCFLKYQILQKSWQEYKFPNLDEKMVHTNPQVIIDTYNKSVERIQIDMDVNQYKIALIIMFLVIEVVSVKFMGLDAGGYTLSQIKAMNRYEKLLIEIGEKKMMIGGDNWPPEVRILFIGLFNCGLFILMKYLSSVLGPELVGYISPIVNGLFSGALDSSKTANLPDDIPQRQQDISGMMGSVASLAAKALSGNQTNTSNNIPTNKTQRASRRPVYRE